MRTIRRRIRVGADVQVLTGVGHSAAEGIQRLAVRVVVDCRPLVVRKRLNLKNGTSGRTARHAGVSRVGGLLVKSVLQTQAEGVAEVVLVVIKRVGERVHRLHRSGHGHEGVSAHARGDSSVVLSSGNRHEVDGRCLQLTGKGTEVVRVQGR